MLFSSDLLILSLVLLASVIFAVILFRKRFCYVLPPIASNSLFDIVANLESGRILEVFLTSCRELCPVFRIRAPQLRHFVVVTDSNLARLILEGDKTRGFPVADKDEMYHRFEPGMLGVPSVFTKMSEGEDWEWARKSIAPIFSNLNIRKKIPILQNTLYKLCEMPKEYENKAIKFDLQLLMFRFTFDFSRVALFGMRFDALGDSETDGSKLLREVEISSKEYFQKQFYNPLRKYFFWNKEVQRGLKAREYVELFQKRILDDYRASMSGEDLKTDPSLLGQLIRR